MLEKKSGPIEELLDGVKMYQGELLLGFCEEWVDLERERLAVPFETTMDPLLDQLDLRS